MAYKARRGGRGKPFVRGKVEMSWYRRGMRWVQRAMHVDREANRYTEKVTDPDTGAVIHECDEPLSEHRGHGSAMKRPVQ